MITPLKKALFNNIYQLLRFQNYIPKSAEVVIDASAQVYGSRLDGNISIGEGTKISRAEIYGKVSIGRYTSVNGPNVDFHANNGSIEIGNFCSIARNVSVQLANHNLSGLTTFPVLKNIFNEEASIEEQSKGDIIIEHDVWIGTQVSILPGSIIRTGAVVAANSVVNSEVPAFAIVGGAPARVIKYRFDNDTIQKILDSAWWEWDLQKIKRNRHVFSDNISAELLSQIVY